jgi:hypothetical protein
MNLRRSLAAVFVMSALAGCAQMPAGQGQTPYAPYSSGDNSEYPRGRGSDGGGGGGGGGSGM